MRVSNARQRKAQARVAARRLVYQNNAMPYQHSMLPVGFTPAQQITFFNSYNHYYNVYLHHERLDQDMRKSMGAAA